MRFLRHLTLQLLILSLAAFVPAANSAPKLISFQAEIWADNWFSLYINGKKVGEDSTPFATEKSFNHDVISFKASYPLIVGIVARDYVENASGLEYVGRPNQQIGDGGIIAQIRESGTGTVVGATIENWKVFVTNKAPLNPECEKSAKPLVDCKFQNSKAPTNWYSITFKDSAWNIATVYTEAEVGVKQGYYNVNWAPSAKLIWASDLKLDNTILIRGKILAPKTITPSAKEFAIGSPDFQHLGNLPVDQTCDGLGISPALSFTGVPLNAQSLALVMDTVPGPLRPGEVDIGNHYYLIIFNIPPTVSLIPAGATNIGTLGKNFQGKKLGYTPPCSQGSGVKEYTITAFALSEKLNLDPNLATEDALLKAIEGRILAKSILVAKYQRKS